MDPGGSIPARFPRLCAIVAAIALATPAVAGVVTPDATLGPPSPSAAPAEAEDDEAVSVGNATIVRDQDGVPHIYADSERALWYANGYTQAKDRLWAMDLLKHLAYGEGASVVGPGGGILEMDLSTRRNLYNETQLRAQLEAAPEDFRESLEAYSDGVERAAAEMRLKGTMPAEFSILQHPFEGWDAIDSVAVATFLLARFGNGGGSEVDNAKLLAQLDETLGDGDALADDAPISKLGDLNWQDNAESYPTIPGSEGTYDAEPQGDTLTTWGQVPEDQREAARAAADAEPFGLQASRAVDTNAGYFANRPIDLDWEEAASNALVVGPSRSETGKAMVGGGPQTGYFNPEILWEVGLHAPDEGIEATGVGVMGAPAVIIGRTADFAWTVTSGISDQTDVVTLEAAGDRSYTWNGTVRDLDCREETHTIRSPPAVYGPAAAEDGQDAGSPVQVVTQEVCRAHLPVTNGSDATRAYPVTSIARDDAGDPTHFFVSKTSSRMEEMASSARWLALDRTDDHEEFTAGFQPDAEEGYPGFAFTFNFHFAGVGDQATGEQVGCYNHVGLQPQRNTSLDPRLPTPAGPEHNWEGFLAGDDLPNACNPEQGYFANWNNRPQASWPSGDSRELWGSVHRVERLDGEMSDALAADGNGRLTLSQVQDVLREAATHDSLAAQVAPPVLAKADDAPAGPADDALADWGKAAYPWDDTVRDSDGDVRYAYRGFTVYEDVVEELLHQIFDDELQDEVRSVTWKPTESDDPHAADHGRHRNKFAILVDALEGRTERNWCDDVTTAALEDCRDQVQDAFEATGHADADGTGEIPRTEERRSPFTSLGAAPAPTMPMTNRATYYHFHVGSDEGRSFTALPPGNSGHLTAVDFLELLATGETPEHVSDQLAMYEDFGFKHLPWSRSSAESVAEETRTLHVPPDAS